MNQNQRDELRHIFLTRNDDELETVCLIAGQILKERLIKMLEIRKEIEPVEYCKYLNKHGNHAEIIDIDKLNIININEADLEKNQRLFINQLKIIHLTEKRLSIAIRDFYRTFTQRSTWVRQNLLYPDEEENYDSELIENWERRFEIMKDEFNTKSSNDDLAKVGNAFYTSYEKSPPHIYIRPRVTDEFLVLGSYHMLANELNIGWHPKYDELLSNKTKDRTL